MTRRITILIAAALVVAVFVPSASAAVSTSGVTPDTYLTRSAANQTLAGSGSVDRLPTPDTYLGQQGIHPGGFLVSSQPASVSTTSDGFNWSSAGVGAAMTAGLIALLVGGFALASPRRRSAGVTRTA